MNAISDAVPSAHFAIPPYRAELFSEKTGWAGVMNAHNVNCLTFKNNPGAVVASLKDCMAIADIWNSK